jgi:hypothetical protein
MWIAFFPDQAGCKCFKRGEQALVAFVIRDASRAAKLSEAEE